jgi:hypothetical protein
MRIVLATSDAPYKHLLADKSGLGMIEIYNNPVAPVPDYASMHPLVLHLAFSVDDVDQTRARLLAARAIAAGDVERLENGDELAMLRDPWGIPLQLAKRGQPLV